MRKWITTIGVDFHGDWTAEILNAVNLKVIERQYIDPDMENGCVVVEFETPNNSFTLPLMRDNDGTYVCGEYDHDKDGNCIPEQWEELTEEEIKACEMVDELLEEIVEEELNGEQAYNIEVMTADGWQKVKPSHDDEPYSYTTEAEARYMMNIITSVETQHRVVKAKSK